MLRSILDAIFSTDRPLTSVYIGKHQYAPKLPLLLLEYCMYDLNAAYIIAVYIIHMFSRASTLQIEIVSKTILL